MEGGRDQEGCDGRTGGAPAPAVRKCGIRRFLQYEQCSFLFHTFPPLLCFLRLRMRKLFPPFPVMGQSLRTSCVLLFLHERPTPTLLLFFGAKGEGKGGGREGGREGDEE